MSPEASPTDNTPPAHTLSPEQVLTDLGSSTVGLASAEVESRRAAVGWNEIAKIGGPKWPSILLAQLKNLLIIILLVATAISAFLGELIEAVAIAVIVLFSIILGFIQEFRAERALLALRKMAAPTARVIRAGEPLTIPARELVPGDVIDLQMGDRIPADARVVDAVNLQTEEAALTGESGAVAKHTAALTDVQLVIADQRNMVFSGTLVAYGRGRAVVTATGLGSEFGRVSGLLETIETPRTPLQANLDHLGRTLATAALIVVAVITAAGLGRGAGLMEMLIFGIALGVAVVPEALPAVVTISLALGVQQMSRRNALVRHLPAVETLGSTAVICADKTGTLTRDQMTVRRIAVAGKMIDVGGSGYAPSGRFTCQGGEVPATGVLEELLRAAALASDARLTHDGESWGIRGEPTEGALVAAAAKGGLTMDELERRFPRAGEIPFTPERKRMTTLHEVNGGQRAYGKGAPEVILATCDSLATEADKQPLSERGRETLLTAAQEMASDALRVIGVAVKHDATLSDAESGMTFLGLLGIQDPPREEAREAIAVCQTAGIRPVMITGDHPETARAIAAELGLLKAGRVVTGAELEGMSAAQLLDDVEDIDVFARVTPEHKLRVVEAWQQRGRVVAMTGDGINDAPALRKADVGIAMGITGTDVSKEAADLTLTDDNFASIVRAVEQGRIIFSNILKYLTYLLSSNIGEIGLIAGATVLGSPLPLTAVQILYVNLATDGLPAIALAVDPPEPGLMQRPPRDPKTGMFARQILLLLLVGGLWSTVANLGLFHWCLASGRSVEQSMTMTFVSLVLIQFFKAYSFRTPSTSILANPFANRWLNLAIAWEIGLLALVVYLPFLQAPFGTYNLDLTDWALVLGTAFTILPVIELGKLAASSSAKRKD
jgi:Ca2+-transporting ATPase